MYVAAPCVTCLIPVTLAWLTNSMKSSTASATATAFVVGFGNLGGIFGPSLYGWLYIPPQSDEPGAHGSFAFAHFAMAAFLSMTIVCALLLLLLEKRDRERHAEDRDEDLLVQDPAAPRPSGTEEAHALVPVAADKKHEEEDGDFVFVFV